MTPVRTGWSWLAYCLVLCLQWIEKDVLDGVSQGMVLLYVNLQQE